MFQDYAVTTPAANLPVRLDAVKSWLRLSPDDAEHDETLLTILESETEAYQAETGLQLITASVTQYLEGWPPKYKIRLPVRPVSAITSVAYIAPDESDYTVLTADQYVSLLSRDPAVIYPAPDVVWPSLNSEWARNVRVIFAAGYGAEPENVPRLCQITILKRVFTAFDYPGAAHEKPLSDDAAMNRLLDVVSPPRLGA